MRTIKMTTGAAGRPGRRSADGARNALREMTAKRELDRTFEDMVREIQHLIEQMTDEERRQYLSESLFLNIVSYENERLGAYMKKLTEKSLAGPQSVSLNYLATRFTCSWPWSTMVLLCDGRMVCGCADPYGKRVLGDARRRASRRSGPATGVDAAPRPQRRRVEVLRRLPAEAAAEEGRSAAAARPRRRRRCRRGCTSSAPPPATSPARRRAARPKPASRGRARPACSTSSCSAASSTRRGPSLGRIDFFNYGEAFLHKRAIEMCEYIKSRFPHIYLYTSTNGLAFTEDRSGGSCTPASTRSPSRSTARRPRATRTTGSAATSTRRSANLRTAADEKRRNGRDVPFINWRYILFTHNDSDEEMALARDDGGRHRRRSALLGAHRSSRGHVLAPLRARHAGARRDQARDLGRQQPRQRDPRRDAARADRRERVRSRRCR